MEHQNIIIAIAAQKGIDGSLDTFQLVDSNTRYAIILNVTIEMAVEGSCETTKARDFHRHRYTC